jgi:AbrB family looped-hinge helix DNA binding protein
MEPAMSIVKVSPKFQVVIPKDVREEMGLTPGTALQVFRYDNRIELVPVESGESLRGFLRGIDTDVLRDEDRP